MKKLEIFFGIIKAPLDFLMTMIAFQLAYQLRLITEPIEGFAKPIDFSTLPTPEQYLVFSSKAAILLVVIFALNKVYILKNTTRFSKEFAKIIAVCGIWVMAIITYFYFTRTFPFSRLAIMYSWILTLIFVTFGRGIIKAIQRSLLSLKIGQRKLIFIGNNKITKELFLKLSQDNNYEIIGVIGEPNGNQKDGKLKLLGGIAQLKYLVKKYKINEIIQTDQENSINRNHNLLELCDLNQINYRFVPSLIEMRQTNISVETISSIPVINLKPTALDGWGKVIKRIMDILGSTIALILFSPIFIITAIAIKLDSKGPILFTKLDDGSPVKRIGVNGEPFKFYKFRSMHPNTDKMRYTELAQNNIRKDGPLVKITNDPRITKVGKFIRKYSIDELPQLFSVLKGDMSLVGPRPHLPEEVAKYQRHHRFVLTIKPGITGLAQVSGRSNLIFEEEVKLDRYYIENWSILFDIKLIFRTLFVISKGYQE